MINELFLLTSALERSGIQSRDWNGKYLLLPKVKKDAPCFRLWLEDIGGVIAIDNLTSELVDNLRKVGNNQASFPGFNIAPLYRISDKAKIERLDQLLEDHSLINDDEIDNFCQENNWRPSLVRKVRSSLTKVAKELQKKINDQGGNRETSISKLIDITTKYPADAGLEFRKRLELRLRQMIRDRENVETAMTLLVYRGNSSATNPEKDSGSISIFLDYAGWRRYEFPVGSQRTTLMVNDLLESVNDRTSPSLRNSIDAFGDVATLEDEPMPKVRIGSIEVSLRTMFAGQPCQYRYRTIEGGSYPISRNNGKAFKRSLEWLADEDREGVTWRHIDRNEVLLVYPSQIPSIPVKFAALFKPPPGSEQSRYEGRFENVAEGFISALDGIPPSEKPDFIHIFTLRKIDKARTKVLYTRNLTPQEIKQAAKDWQQGCENIPSIDSLEGHIPFPLNTARIFNAVWKRTGVSPTSVPRIKYYQGFELFFDPLTDSELTQYMHLLVENTTGLFYFWGNILHSQELIKSKLRNSYAIRLDLANILAMFGLLLFKHGSQKEIYMENLPFLLGQWLRISDELHALYCKLQRDGDVPPQLVGNSVLVAASDSPDRALALLLPRMAPYIAWAKQYRTKNSEFSRMAGWYLNLYEQIADRISSQLSEKDRFDDFDKAQILLGYLASFPKKEKDALSVTTTEEKGEDKVQNNG